MNKLRIALVYDAVYPFSKGGGERRFYEMGKRLAAKGFHIDWYCMKYWDGDDTYEHDGMTLHGIMKARPLYIKGGRRSISQALLFGIASIKLLGAKFDVIDCCGFPYFSMFPAKVAAVIKRKPLFATWHEVWGLKYWNEYLGRLGFIGFIVEKLASKLPNHIIAVSDFTHDKLKKELNVKQPISIIPNGVNLSFINSINPSANVSDIIFLGRLVDYKNVDMIIEALAVLKDQNKKLKLNIIGDGPEKKNLQQLAKKLKVNDQIDWLGFVSDDKDVYSILKSSKLFILPSEREGFGIVLIEANACGLPVLTLEHAGNAAQYLIRVKENGDLFDDVDSLAEKIEKILSIGNHLTPQIKRIVQRYDLDNSSDQITHIYKLETAL